MPKLTAPAQWSLWSFDYDTHMFTFMRFDPPIPEAALENVKVHLPLFTGSLSEVILEFETDEHAIEFKLRYF